MKHASILLIAVAVLTINLCACGLLAADFYVAPTGDDANPGTLDKPFATIAAAQAAVRAGIKAGLTEPVTVHLRGGVYELDAPLSFGPADSGSTLYSVTYAAYSDERPLISGGRTVDSLRKSAGGLLSAKVPPTIPPFRQLYNNGKRLSRGRFPEEGFLRITKVSPDVKTIEFDRPLPADIVGQDAEIVVIQNWSISRGIITDAKANTLTSATPLGWVGHSATTSSPGKPAYIEHAPQLLTKPGRYHLDRTKSQLLYKPHPGENIANIRFTAPLLEKLLTIKGTPEKPVRNLRFKGLSFAYSAWRLPEGGYAGIQGGYNGTENKPNDAFERALPAAIRLDYADDCAFEFCRFAHIGSTAIGLSVGTRRNRIVACEFTDIGGNGIHIGLPAGPIRTLDQDWANPRDIPTGNEVTNCRVRDCAAESFGCVGVFAAFTEDTRISRNHVSHVPYTGISIGFRWNPTPSSQKNCIVEFNHIHDCLLTLADGGGIYTLGYQPGTILRGNHIHDIHRSSYAHGGAPNNGIFFDEGSTGFLVEANVIYNTSGNPIRFNQNKIEWHTWRDNSFGPKPSDQNFPQQDADYAGINKRYLTRLPLSDEE